MTRLALLVFLVAACGGSTPATPDPNTPTPTVSAQETLEAYLVDPLSSELLRRYGLEPAGPTELSTFRVTGPDEGGWDIPLDASREIGLDYAHLLGRTVEMRTTPVAGNLGPQHDCVGCSKGGRVHVLVSNQQVVGAWLSDKVTVPGVYALSDAHRWCSDDDC